MSLKKDGGVAKVKEDKRTLSLEKDGIDCVPAIGYNHYLNVSKCNEYHTHPGCVEFVFCLRGDCTYSTPEGECQIRAGGVMVSRPDQPHMLQIYHKGLRMYWIHLRLPRRGFPLLGLPKRESDWIAARLMNFPKRIFSGNDDLRRHFNRIFEVCDTTPRKSAERTVLLRAAVMDILTTALMLSTSTPNAPSRKVVAGLIDEIRNHPERRYPLGDLAERAAMSVSNLLIAFKRQTGLSPHAFQLSCRIESAKRLLAGGKSVSSVSDAVGFSSQKRFSAYFRQAVGLSPREWLKERK